MKSLYSVILKPLISEKSDLQRDDDRVYTFEVHKDANKFDVKTAVERIFNVEVKAVRTSIVRGKVKRVGRHSGKSRNWKKAFVTLKEGQEINLFENT
jgi:large subunit ribosomal protein L23